MSAACFEWKPAQFVGFIAEMPDNVTLVATPDKTASFGNKPARGTCWRAQCSQWDGKSTISRFGRDEYNILHKTKNEAMRSAERIYLDACSQ